MKTVDLEFHKEIAELYARKGCKSCYGKGYVDFNPGLPGGGFAGERTYFAKKKKLKQVFVPAIVQLYCGGKNCSRHYLTLEHRLLYGNG